MRLVAAALALAGLALPGRQAEPGQDERGDESHLPSTPLAAR